MITIRRKTLAFTMIASIAGTFVIDLFTPLGLPVWLLYLVPVVVSSRADRRGWSLAVTALCSLLIGIGLYFSPPGSSLAFGMVNRLIGVALLWAAAFTAASPVGDGESKRRIAGFDRHAFVGLTAACLIMILVAGMTYRVMVSHQDAQQLVAHTYEVLNELSLTVSSLKDAETGQRGFLVTGNDQYLEPYKQALVEIHEHFGRLTELTHDNPAIQNRFPAFQAGIDEKLAELRQTIIARRNQGPDAARRIVETGRGKAIMDGLRRMAVEMERTERPLLAQRAEQSAIMFQSLNLLLVFGGSAIAVLLVATFLFLQRERNAQRKHAALIQSARLHSETIIDTVREPLVVLDETLRVQRANRSYYHGFRTTKEETEGRFLGELGSGQWNSTQLRARLETIVPQHTEFNDFEVEQNFPSIGRRTMLLNARKLYRPGNNTTQILLAIEDITERRGAEKERERFFSLSLDMFCFAGFDGYFKYLNPAWEKTLGFTSEELMAKPYLDFVHPDDRQATIVEASKIRTGATTIAFENRYRCKDGTYRLLLWNATPAVEQQIIYATARDITERKRTEEVIELRSKQLQAANKELEAFSYSVSHDLRAPLRHIDGFADLLQRHAATVLDDKGRRYLTMISESAKQMGTLVDDLLAFSRMGRADMRQTIVNLNELVKEVRQDLHQDTQSRKIVWNVAELPSVYGDPAMLRQVLTNLIANAVKYTRTREQAQISIGCLNGTPSETTVFIKDNGVGFDMQYVEKLFGVFQRLHSANEFEGTGIGLANVQRIIHRHGGRVWAKGVVNGGATFYFSVPTRMEGKQW